MARERYLTFDERAKWGACPVCHAPDGVACNGEIGIPLGRTCGDRVAEGGAHLGRLLHAPLRIREVAIR